MEEPVIIVTVIAGFSTHVAVKKHARQIEPRQVRPRHMKSTNPDQLRTGVRTLFETLEPFVTT